MKHSDFIADFIKYIDDAKSANAVAESFLHEQERIECDILHKIELDCNYDERCRLATQLKDCLCERRYYKDILEQTQPIIDWAKDGRNANALNQLKQVLGKARKAEDYVKNRTYKPRTNKVEW